jgi:hypothetical protein
MARRFRVTANFPILGRDAHQSVIVEGSNWMVALGKAARELKRLPVMHRRRITALSMVLEQTEGQGIGIVEQAPAAEQTVMSQPEGDPVTTASDDYEEANAEAEALIADGPEIETEEGE